ncbi:sugar phosphate nucleotidyltransferase [Chloroflexota bacterium]
MKAVILVGGKATRLEPLTINTPKALIPVLNIPFLEYVVRNLSSHQIKEIVLALGHLSRPIEGYLGDGSRFGAKLHYSIEDTPLGSAGAAKKAEKYLGETFLVFNGDDFIDLDFTAMMGLHRERRAKVTIALTRVDDPTNYGLVETDTGSRVIRFLEKPKPEEVTTDTVNAGAWLVEPEVMSLVPPGTQMSFERNIFPELLARGEPVYAYTTSGYWMDAGTPEKYLQLHSDLLSGKSRQYLPGGDLSAGEFSEIHNTAEITGPVIIGSNCSIEPRVKLIGPVVIGDGCTILENCLIEDSTLWQNIRLEPGVNLKGCIIADNCRLGAGSGGEGVVLADNVTVESGVKLETGSKIQPGTTVRPIT